jgi:hypothetical protein
VRRPAAALAVLASVFAVSNLASTGAAAAPAPGYIYWANDGGASVGRANLGGTGAPA